MDQNGFNYGRGWGDAPKPPIYQEAMKRCRDLSEEATRMSAKAWALEMALWRVRIATTGPEKAIAMMELLVELDRQRMQIAAE